MKKIRFVIVCLACLCWQCKDKKDATPQPAEQKEIDVLDFSIPGVDPKNITVADDLIVIRLPENYAQGDYIKPDIVLGAGYSTQSPLLNGMSYDGKEITLELENFTRGRKTFNVIVVPQKAIELAEPAKNLQLTIAPETSITTSFDLKGTRATVNDSGKLVYDPIIRFTDKATGQISQELYADPGYAHSGNELIVTLPVTTIPGEYIAEVVWGTKTDLLSSQVTVKAGPVQFKRGSWHMLGSDRYFEVNGFNLSPSSKYEAIVQNDFVTPQRISLKYEKPGTLSGNLPEDFGLGNYKITYLQNGKETEPYPERQVLERYSGDDHFYIRKTSTQPIARIVTQPSRRSSFDTGMGFNLPYYPSATEISRHEPILVYTESWGAFPNKNELILADHSTGKEYALPYSGDVYPIFDGFLAFLSYPVTENVPSGKYEVYIIRGTEKTERYGQIITLK